MEDFKLFEKVTGRVSLKTGKILESALKEACRRAGSQYHEAADEILISGSWQQVSETRRIISSRIQDGGGTWTGASGRESSSSSDYSESISSKSGVISFDTKPQIAKYIKTFHHNALKKIEQDYSVKISWSKDYTKVHIKDLSTLHYNDKLLSNASEKFVELYHHFTKTVGSIPFNVSCDEEHYSKEYLKDAVHSIPQHVYGVILDQSEDGRVCKVWGTASSLKNAQDWIREKLSVTMERPKSYSPKGPPKNALVHETVNKLKVVVYQGDITKENADIIVNACNKHLDHAGGVSYAISKAGGPSIQGDSDAYVRKHGSIQTGCVAITTPGYLHCKHIVHAVGPQWKKHGKERCMELFQTLFMNVYKAACKVGARSIAMPAISSGIYGVPKNVCAQAVFLFVDEINQKLASDSSARPFEIRLVNIDGETVEAFSTELNKWKLKGRKMQRRHSFDVVREKEVEKPVERKSVDDMVKTPRMKFTLGPLFRRQKASSKDGNAQTSKIKYIGGCTSTDNSSATSTVSHGSSTAGSKVKKGASTTSLQDSNDPPSSKDPSSFALQSFASSVLGTSNARFNSSSHPATTGSSSYGAVLSTSQSSTLSLRKKSDSTIRHEQNGIDSHSPDSGDDPDNCTICFSPYTHPVTLSKCGHKFCKSCIKRAFTYQKKCPVCQQLYGVCEGDQPDGTMEVKKSNASLPGYEGYAFYVITYDIPSGIQGNKHPKPGKKFTGTSRQAYVPATEEGTTVLNMLQKAFEKKLIFTVGTSTTTGKEDCVTWNDIHHKTSISGGPDKFGYPDPTYLGRVTEELKAKGIVPE